MRRELFIDSLAFAKRFILEKGSRDVDLLCFNASELALSTIYLPEIISALKRRKKYFCTGLGNCEDSSFG